jgi:hypothetical protein
LLSNDYVPLSNTGIWNFAKTDYIYGENNQNTHYILKASMVDVAGNILKSIDQSFVVDLLKPSFIRTDREFIFIAGESGDFIFNGIKQENKNQLDLKGKNNYLKGEFELGFSDSAGNVSDAVYKNSTAEDFSNGVKTSVSTPSPTAPSKFGSQVVGSIGEYVLAADEVYDLASLHTGISSGLRNHFDMSDTSGQTLKLTTSDVLALGVKNSFVSNGHQQIRIDGDALDKVLLDDLLGGSTFEWAKAVGTVELNHGQRYAVYSNDALGLDLFIQQGIVTTVL